MAFVSWKIIKLKAKLNPSDTTLTADIDVWISAWRLYLKSNLQEEWISFTWVSPSWSNFSYTWLTRGLSQTADPVTAWTGKTWVAWNSGAVVAMHDELWKLVRQSTNNITSWDTNIDIPITWDTYYKVVGWVHKSTALWNLRISVTTDNFASFENIGFNVEIYRPTNPWIFTTSNGSWNTIGVIGSSVWVSWVMVDMTIILHPSSTTLSITWTTIFKDSSWNNVTNRFAISEVLWAQMNWIRLTAGWGTFFSGSLYTYKWI